MGQLWVKAAPAAPAELVSERKPELFQELCCRFILQELEVFMCLSRSSIQRHHEFPDKQVNKP